MYYEEKVINGVLYSRDDPDGNWVPCTPAYLTLLYKKEQEKSVNLEEKVLTLESRMSAIAVMATPLNWENSPSRQRE